MYKPGNYPILDTIHYPADVRKLSKDQLPALARELREYLTHTVSISGGHFAAGLGTVELTIALHYVFDTPA
ncbi:1-deoxy-D-xylulose-5-phosphate synthase N-terminal domain-containing protein, partial [Methylobacter sp.]|uniref:1-deoxy-D-xylulose-5-phosphate synthase N-terminal domain-containing protein n=1 Tax=Methylobacter sp. TaxID=2051955 RepID=UPI003DA39547